MAAVRAGIFEMGTGGWAGTAKLVAGVASLIDATKVDYHPAGTGHLLEGSFSAVVICSTGSPYSSRCISRLSACCRSQLWPWPAGRRMYVDRSSKYYVVNVLTSLSSGLDQLQKSLGVPSEHGNIPSQGQ